MRAIILVAGRGSRLPKKLSINPKSFLKIGNKTVLKRVWLRCRSAVEQIKIYVATGDKRILEYCKINSIQTIFTNKIV